MKKSIDLIPNYYCCTLYYAEDLCYNQLILTTLPNIIIEESISFDNFILTLVGIIYFFDLHYTVHVRGIHHPKLFESHKDKWFYHDGLREGTLSGKFTRGLLFENNPKLEVDVTTEKLKPYILIYKVFKKD